MSRPYAVANFICRAFHLLVLRNGPCKETVTKIIMMVKLIMIFSVLYTEWHLSVSGGRIQYSYVDYK